MRNFTELIETFLLDKEGKRRNESLEQLLKRVFTKENIEKFGSIEILDVIELIKDAFDEKEALKKLMEKEEG